MSQKQVFCPHRQTDTSHEQGSERWHGEQKQKLTAANLSRRSLISFSLTRFIPYGNRTRVFAMKRRRPRPLDERNTLPTQLLGIVLTHLEKVHDTMKIKILS